MCELGVHSSIRPCAVEEWSQGEREGIRQQDSPLPVPHFVMELHGVQNSKSEPDLSSCFEGLFVKVCGTYINNLFKRLLALFINCKYLYIWYTGPTNAWGRTTCARFNSISSFSMSA